jgi:hypothetical protein
VHGEAAEHDPLARREQLPAPVDHRTQGALPVGRSARPAGEQREPVVEPGKQLVHAERAHPPRGELERERQAVEPSADRRDRGRGALVEGEPGRGRRGPRREQPHRTRRAHRIGIARGGHLQRQDLPQHLACHPERLPARGEDPQAGRGRQELPGERGNRVDHLFAVVEHQEQPRAGECLPDPVDEPRGALADAECGRHRRDHRVLGRTLGLRAHLPIHTSELDKAGAVGVGVLARHRHRQARLPDPARPGERDEPRRTDPLPHLDDRSLAPDQLGERGPDREPGPGRSSRCWPLQRRVLREDRLLQCGDLGAGFEAEVGDERGTQLGELGERLTLPAGAVERAHEQAAQPLAPRVPRHQLPQLGNERPELSAPEREPGLGALLLRRQPLLLEPLCGGDRERLVADIGERRAAPQRQRVDEQGDAGSRIRRLPRRGGERAEPVDVERTAVDSQQVAGRLADDESAPARLGALQRTAKLRDLGLERVQRVAGRPNAPQVPDEPLHGDRAALVDEEVGQERADLPLRHPHRAAVVGPDGQRAQHPETHGTTVTSRTDRPAPPAARPAGPAAE